ncbi:GtrA family protein [Roseofilum sp. BLCC_M91]|uniref:GtrA family protein n=1 Tax=Roseofilum halophilum BLCC-M91 TaxID=3022259 RepID=A0ABT7BJU8_9CYAN|nr:GtrA family protein [Roseofilum halophilum]MDJ1179463.1 GtrA family protein [Roseofilum halophilum BLCC-M91]
MTRKYIYSPSAYSRKTNRLISHFSNYPIYFLVGVFNTLFTIGLRHILGLSLDRQGGFAYIVSMLLSSCIGILVSFIAHKKITFPNRNQLSVTQELKQLGLFFINQSTGMILAILFSVMLVSLMTVFPFDLGNAKTLAFAFSSFLVSFITYILNKKIVFK